MGPGGIADLQIEDWKKKRGVVFLIVSRVIVNR
jgi:hypothetical protein